MAVFSASGSRPASCAAPRAIDHKCSATSSCSPRPRASRCRCGRPGASRPRWHRRSRWADRQPGPGAGRHGPAAARRTRCPRTPGWSSTTRAGTPAGVQPHPAGRRRGDRPQQHRIEVTGHLRRVRLLFAWIGAMHIDRRDQAIADPQRVVAEVLESAAECAQTSGAAHSGPDYGNCETKLHREAPLSADDRRPAVTGDIPAPFSDS